MKKKATLFLIAVIILCFFSSCKSKKDPSPEVGRTGAITSTPEITLNEPTPSVEKNTLPPSPPPASPPPPVTEKKPEAPKPLGTYQTVILNKDKQRVDNIKLAIKKINGKKLKPGETFSFNKIVGKRDAENGFKVATVIINGEYGEDMGGGICQLSSTIYNAAEKAGMEIIERHSHSRSVKYVPKGKDAAVSFDYLDLKFKNNKNYSIEIKASIEGSKLRVSLFKVKN